MDEIKKIFLEIFIWKYPYGEQQYGFVYMLRNIQKKKILENGYNNISMCGFATLYGICIICSKTNIYSWYINKKKQKENTNGRWNLGRGTCALIHYSLPMNVIAAF